jgi:hypothetical protein
MEKYLADYGHRVYGRNSWISLKAPVFTCHHPYLVLAAGKDINNSKGILYYKGDKWKLF